MWTIKEKQQLFCTLFAMLFVYYACKNDTNTYSTACIPGRIRFTFTKSDLMLSVCIWEPLPPTTDFLKKKNDPKTIRRWFQSKHKLKRFGWCVHNSSWVLLNSIDTLVLFLLNRPRPINMLDRDFQLISSLCVHSFFLSFLWAVFVVVAAVFFFFVVQIGVAVNNQCVLLMCLTGFVTVFSVLWLRLNRHRQTEHLRSFSHTNCLLILVFLFFSIYLFIVSELDIYCITIIVSAFNKLINNLWSKKKK